MYLMTNQTTYRGLPFRAKVFETVETTQQAMFLGRTANITSPLKSPVNLDPDIRFFGRQATSATISKNIVLDIDAWVPA